MTHTSIVTTTQLALLGLVCCQATWAARPVARVLEVSGDVHVAGDGQTGRRVLAFGTLYADERIVLDRDSGLVLAFRLDGHIERVCEAGEFSVAQEGCQPRDKVRIIEIPPQHAPFIERAVRQLPAVTRSGAIFVRSAGDRFGAEFSDLLFPDDGKSRVADAGRAKGYDRPSQHCVVPITRPKFVWGAVPGVERYRLAVYDDSDELWSTNVNKNTVTYGGSDPLRYGSRYRWQVTIPGPSEGPHIVHRGFFAIATETEATIATTLRELGQKQDVSKLTLAALWYQQCGMLDEALDVSDVLLKLQPTDSGIREFKADLLDQAERADEAKEMRRSLETTGESDLTPSLLP